MTPNELIERNYDLIDRVQRIQWRLVSLIPRDDMQSEIAYALTQAAYNWEDYCVRKGYDPASVSYFRPYAIKRMKGAVLDAARVLHPLNRRQREANVAVPGWQYRTPLHFEDGFDTPNDTDIESDYSAREILKVFHDAFLTLSKLEQTVLALHYYKEIPIGGNHHTTPTGDITTILGKNHGQSISKIHAEALMKLRRIMVQAVTK